MWQAEVIRAGAAAMAGVRRSRLVARASTAERAGGAARGRTPNRDRGVCTLTLLAEALWRRADAEVGSAGRQRGRARGARGTRKGGDRQRLVRLARAGRPSREGCLVRDRRGPRDRGRRRERRQDNQPAGGPADTRAAHLGETAARAARDRLCRLCDLALRASVRRTRG